MSPRALQRAARPVRYRRRSGGGAVRSRRVHAFRHPREDRAGGRRRSVAGRGRTHARPRASPRSCRCGCCRAPGRCCSRASPRCEAAGRPLAAAEMVLVRIAYAADLPTPGRGDPLARRTTAARAPRRAAMAARPRRRRGAPAAPRFDGSRFEAPRGDRAPRPRAGCGAAPAIRRCAAGRRSAAAPPALRGRQLRGPDRARRREARPRGQGWRSSATCGWCAARTAGSRSRSSRARPRRWSTIWRASSRNGPTGAGWSWCRREHGQPTVQVAERRAPGRAQDRRARRSAGAGGAGALSRRRDRRRARAATRSPRGAAGAIADEMPPVDDDRSADDESDERRTDDARRAIDEE